jgi:hypothetical protein
MAKAKSKKGKARTTVVSLLVSGERCYGWQLICFILARAFPYFGVHFSSLRCASM